MIRIPKITEDSSQSFNLRGEKGEAIGFSLRYLPRIRTWVFDIINGTFTLTGAALVNSPNVLRNYRNNLTFGLLCTSTDGLDPAYLDDFINGRVNLFLLNQADIAAVEATYFPGVEGAPAA